MQLFLHNYTAKFTDVKGKVLDIKQPVGLCKFLEALLWHSSYAAELKKPVIGRLKAAPHEACET